MLKENYSLKLYKKAFEILVYLNIILFHLPSLKNIDKIRNNLKIFDILIDIICLVNNIIVFKHIIQFNIFAPETFENLILCEINCLKIAASISFLMDYNNIDTVKYIFNKIIDKLCEYKDYKDNLKEKLFTPHIAYIRFYSIFLNRFCFNYSINNNCDLIESFQYFQDRFPRTKELSLFLFKELINCFGFIISQSFYFWKYYDLGMVLYPGHYFNKESDIIINCDVALMKYLLTTSQIQKEFNINNILTYSNIDSCNDFFLNIQKINLNEMNYLLNLKSDNEEANFSYIDKILEYISYIIKNNI